MQNFTPPEGRKVKPQLQCKVAFGADFASAHARIASTVTIPVIQFHLLSSYGSIVSLQFPDGGLFLRRSSQTLLLTAKHCRLRLQLDRERRTWMARK
ncbi:hypothetical protein NPIL_14481 [Nephila pilipes]|uniref:Uncharacterized protein n=1 Tax=Nephila pilipes TaxID=299642 RepID=A0A8X6UQ67_NEPPI|nr:hypothetical protein NPIL_14481 [Nephila pilipes]